MLATFDEVTLPSSPPEIPRPVANGLTDVVAQVQEARRPLLWAGSGVIRAGAVEQFRKLATDLQIPSGDQPQGQSCNV